MPVTIVVPAFNEARRLPVSLPRLLPAVHRMDGAEVIVVDDGSTDGTAAIATELLRDVPGGRVVRLPWNSGKGTAVRAGVSAARGQSIAFMDADMASDVNDLPELLSALQHAEVVLGSRRIGDSALRTSGRRMGSWAFNQVTRTFASLDVADTQCGFKAFRHAEAKILFSMSRSTGFGFDVEVLSIARAMGYRIVEVPVRWAETPGGTFSMTKHTPAMLVDVLRSRRYLRRYAPALRAAPQDEITADVPAQTSRLPGGAAGAGAGAAGARRLGASAGRVSFPASAVRPGHPVPLRPVVYPDDGTHLTTVGVVADTTTPHGVPAEVPGPHPFPRKVV